MRWFGTSGVNPSRKNTDGAKPAPSKKSTSKPLKEAIREAVRANANKAKKAESKTSQKADESVRAKPAKPKRRPNVTLPSVEFKPFSIGGSIAGAFTFTISWMPFAIALGFTVLVIKTITEDFEALGIGKGNDTALEGITPHKPPVIYEKGLEQLRPSRDDRVPVEALSDEYDLNDPMLVSKLTGVGVIYHKGSRCTANVLARRDFLVTASHCLVKPSGKKLKSGDFKFYSPTCNAWYSGVRMFVRTNQYKTKTDLDYAVLKLDTPVCEDSVPFQAVTITDETALELKARKHPLLSISVQPFRNIRRKNDFPKAENNTKPRHDGLAILGVFGRFSDRHSNIGTQDGSLTYYIDGVDAFGGASGGAALISLDGGKTYQILGTMYGHLTSSGIGIFPRIRGEFADHIEEYYAKWQRPSETGGAS